MRPHPHRPGGRSMGSFHKRSTVWTAVAALLLSGCGTTSVTSVPSDSGIMGTILVQPDCKPPASGTNCENQPLAADVVVVDARNGVPVASFSSGSDGRF